MCRCCCRSAASINRSVPIIATGVMLPLLFSYGRSRNRTTSRPDTTTAVTYGFEVYEVVPDFLVLSKTLGGGVPIGAVITSPTIEATCHDHGFVHVTSHVSDPLPAAAALAVIEVVREQELPARAERAGERLGQHLGELVARHEFVGDVRGLGLLWGLELVEDRDSRRPAEAMGMALTDECEQRGLSINLVRGGTGGAANCLRMAPPLTISDDEIDLAAEILDASLAAVGRRPAHA